MDIVNKSKEGCRSRQVNFRFRVLVLDFNDFPSFLLLDPILDFRDHTLSCRLETNGSKQRVRGILRQFSRIGREISTPVINLRVSANQDNY